MPEPKRPLTTSEAAQLRAALPERLKKLLDHIYVINPTCWNCECFSNSDGMCQHWDSIVPMDKRQSTKDCWTHEEPEPF